MAEFAQYCLIGALIFLVVALLMNLVVAASQGRAAPRRAGAARTQAATAASRPAVSASAATSSASTTTATLERTALDDDLDDLDDEPARPPSPAASTPAPLSVGSLATGFTIVSLLLLTAYLVARGVQAGYLPLTNMHGYAAGFVWIILLASLIAFRVYRVRLISVVSLIVAGLLLVFAITEEFSADPLVPALQNSVLLTLHVGFAILASGAACVSFAGAVLYLLQPSLRRLRTPRATFDEIGYKAAVVTFPLWTIMVLLGALWANTAWGAYWSWDPKETAALVTWLVYAAYLHARVVGGWRGVRASWLLVAAFVAVLFTLFGNYFFGGLHSYA